MQKVYQVINEFGYDAGNDWHMGVFESRALAEEWVEEIQQNREDGKPHGCTIRERYLISACTCRGKETN